MTTPWKPVAGRPVEESEVSLEALAGRTVAVIGYGTMGRAHALNLRDSGVDVIVGARHGSVRGALARDEGLTVHPVPEAAARASVAALMLPDEAMGPVYVADVAPHLRPDAALAFAHGFAVAFGQIDPRERPCFLVAPKSQGDLLRESFATGGGAPGLLAVSDGSPPQTWSLCAAYARAVGCLRGGGWPTTFRAECVADQFGEQAVLCGGMVELLQAAFDTLVARGYDRANAYFECVHELTLITSLLHRHGIEGMRRRISPTAAYGGLTRGPRVIDQAVRERLSVLLDEIEDGRFGREFLARHADPQRGVQALADREAGTDLAAAGRQLQSRLDALGARPGDAPASKANDPHEESS